MNQILLTKDEKKNTLLGINPIVKFFAIVIIVFALILVGEGGYKLYSNLSSKGDIDKPTLSAEKKGSTMFITIQNKTSINKVYYSWNDGNETELNGEGKGKVSYEIEIPQGESILKVSVIDVHGNKTKFDDIKVDFAPGEDTVNPKLSITKSETTGKINIKATDDTALDYLTYKWENGEEVKINATDATSREIVQEINVQKGTNNLICYVVDKAGNDYEKTTKIVGSDGAEIAVSISDGAFLVRVTSESGITKIMYTHNDKEQTVNDLPKNAKEFEFKVPLQDGQNLLKINAYENDIMTEYKCKKTKN